MGRSVDAHIAFGWIMPEGWSVPEELTYGEYGCLEVGWAGSLWAGDPRHILYHKDAEIWATYEAKEVSNDFLNIDQHDFEHSMRKDGADLNIEFPDSSAQWIVWALEG